MINQNFSNFNNFTNRENYKYINDFKNNNTRHSLTTSLDKVLNQNINIQPSNITQEKRDISPKKYFSNNNITNLKEINRKNEKIIINQPSHNYDNKSLNFDISKNNNYKEILELNKDKNSPQKKLSIPINRNSINYNQSKINNFYSPHIRSQSHNNGSNKSIVSINNNNTSIHNNFQFLSNLNEQKVSGISVQDNYISFLQKQLDDSVKKNKELIIMYKDIEKTCEKLTLENKKLNMKLMESENKFNQFHLKKEELVINNKNIQDESNKKEIELQNKLKETENELNLLKNSLNGYEQNNNELKQNLLLMSNKLTDTLNKDTNIFEKELNLLKSQNELLSNNLLSKNQNLESLQNENIELSTENKILKDQVEDYKNRYNDLKNSLNIQNNIKTNPNESKDSFYTTDTLNLTNDNLIYKRKSSSEFSFQKSKVKTEKKKIDEIKLKLPYSSSKNNPKIKEIPIRYNENFDIENDFFTRSYTDNNYNKNEINDLFIKSNILNQTLRNYDTFNFMINKLERCLFNIDNNCNLIKFEIKTKKFSKILLSNNPKIKIYDDYKNNFIYEGSIILNTLNGIFILTGKNTDLLYYYNDQNKTIRKICKFNDCHNSGSLFLDEVNKSIIVFSGKFNKKVEYFSFENGKINNYPELNIERANATYSLINNKLYALFGFCCPMNSYTQNIEYINFQNMDSWKIISLNSNFDIINLNIHCISNLQINGKNSIIIFGGIKNEGEIIFDSFLIFDADNNLITKILVKNNQNYGCIFTKNTNFIPLDNNYLLIDDNNNVHFVDQNLQFSLFKFKI
jgi:hypothetical protein